MAARVSASRPVRRLRDPPPRRDATAGELSAFRAGAFRYSAPSSLAGVPEVVIPVLHVAGGRRLGIGLVCGHRRDGGLVRAAMSVCPDGYIAILCVINWIGGQYFPNTGRRPSEISNPHIRPFS
ncbi:hypothetical protein [Streptosporangium sp. NPDC004631]